MDLIVAVGACCLLSFADKKLSFHDRSRYRTLAASDHATCGFIANTHHLWSLGVSLQ
jgi:hypothetical protein